MKAAARRIATSKLLWIAVGLVALYAAAGFFLAPYLVERMLPRYAMDKLGSHAAIGDVRVNPFLMQVEVKGLRLEDGERPAIELDRLFADLELASIVRWAWTFANIELDGLRLNAEITPDGRFNLAQIAERWREKKRGDASADGTPRVVAQHFALHRGTLTFTDRSLPQPAAANAYAIDLDVTELATLPDETGRYTISAQLPQGGALSWRGGVSLQPIASSGEWRFTGIKLGTLWQFWRNELAISEPAGILNFAGKYDFTYNDGVAAYSIKDVGAQITGVSLTFEGQSRPVFVMQSIEAGDARYDPAKHEIIVPKLKLVHGDVAAEIASDGTLNWQRFIRSNPAPAKPSAPTSPLHLRTEAVTVDNVELRYTDHSRAKPLVYVAAARNGGFALDVARGAESTHVVIDKMRLALADAIVRATDAKQALVDLESVDIEGGRIDSEARMASFDSVAVKGGSTALTHLGDGRIALIDAFSAAHNGAERAPQHTDETARWKYSLRAADLSNVSVAISDETYKPPVRYDIAVTGSLASIESDGKSPMELKAALHVKQGGTINAAGTLAQDFAQASVKVDAAGLVIEPLRPVLARYTTLDLKAGRLASAAARVEYHRNGKPMLQLAGNAQVGNLLINEASTGDRFLSWRTLNADDMALTISPNRLNIKEVRIEGAGAKIFIGKDHTVNVSRVLKPDVDSAPVSRSKSIDEPFPLRIARVHLQHGALDFADGSLVLPFAARVRSVSGTIVGLSTAPKSRAELKLEGVVEPNGSAKASGSLEPSNPRSFLDIHAVFENVEMPALSPYTATFAGRKVAAGRLWLDVEYKIVNSQLLGENKIVMADFALGERVQAPEALDLPLDLAVALLKEPDGRIHLAVPVRGDVDNPKFEYGVLIRDAIVNALKRIVTAPFRFIAGLLGGQADENLQSIRFDPGSARLMPPMREQLQKVAEALKTRPQLKLVVHGAYDPKRDAQALRDAEVRQALVQATGVKLKPGEDPGPVAFDDADTQRALEKLLAARSGDDAVARFAAQYAKSTGKEAHRVNPLLAAFGRGGGDRDFYLALYDELVKTQPLPDQALADLAARRAHAITEFMARAGMQAPRVEAGKTQTVEDESKPLAAVLALEAA